MDYSNLFLNNELIDNVFKINQKRTKRIGRGFASLVKLGAEKDAIQECNKCDHKTGIYNNMYQHNRIIHSNIKHQCTECDYTHAYPSKVKSHHKQVHLGVPRNSRRQICRKDVCKDVGKSDCKEILHFLLFCDQCDFSTKRYDNLKIHIKRVHEGLIELFACDQCDLSFNLKSSLKRHASVKHIGEAMKGIYRAVEECDFEDCTYKTQFKFKLRIHIETKHEGIVRFRCEFMNCTYGANDRRSLKEHTVTHSSEKISKISKCFICEKTFSRSRTKDLHIKNVHEGLTRNLKHNGEKAFKCNLCDKTFTTKSQRDWHIKNIHEGIWRFSCQHIDCSYGTQDKQKFEAHTRKHNSGKESKCHFCDGTYTTQRQKKNHIKTIHGEVWKELACNFCDKTFSRQYHRNFHIKTIHEGCDCKYGTEKKHQL